jgi:16S rRNA (guanine527-N7)-methyltransferase
MKERGKSRKIERDPADISERQISEILATYGVAASSGLCTQIREYVALLIAWNRKISLTAIRNSEEIVRFHFGESLFAVKTVPVENGRLADVGSGAGFPGVALAMASSSLDLTLIEPNQKKATFLSEVVRTLSLLNVRVLRRRIEHLGAGTAGFDFITARALGRYESLIRWSSHSLTEKGRLVLWIGEADAQLVTREPALSWNEPKKIPGSRNRILLVGSRK